MKGKRNNSGAAKRKTLVLAGVCLLVFVLVIVLGIKGFQFLRDVNISPVYGVDVSSYQGDIDWKDLKEENYHFAYIKATEGSSHKDVFYKGNQKRAKKAGIATGAYHFLSFDTDGDTQALNFIAAVDKKGNSLPPAVDIELYGDYESVHPDRKKVQAILDEFLYHIEDHYGRRPMLYTNAYVYDLYLTGDYEEYPIWISDPEMSEVLNDGRRWTICQYSFEGETDAVEAQHVDLNLFKGNLWELKHLD